METKAVRVFYRKSDNQIVWYHELRGVGEFPASIEADLAEIPDKKPNPVIDIDGNITDNPALGGVPEDYACIEEVDPQRAVDFLASDENLIVDGELFIGIGRS